ncbi:hypothetical protein XF_1017 [Xylella fastidiosa 9a5c]|uniref:Uncharacterized protein n=1 Tax=Xylella fastidiosa (strain 9a5c) TaxID=160492 RepID=Q9PEL1_XYLFA|nr:hypothetical protein XF_1017 [Xylella fastidiosa 9a5c]
MNRTRKKDSTTNELFQPQPQRNLTTSQNITELSAPAPQPKQIASWHDASHIKTIPNK